MKNNAIWRWFSHNWGWLLGTALTAAMLGWMWYVTGVAAMTSQVPMSRSAYLAQSTITVLRSFGPLLNNAWFVGFLIVIALFGEQVHAFLGRTTSLEVSGLRLQSAEIKEPTLVLDSHFVWTTGPWGPPEADVPGGDGPMLERKEPGTEGYEAYALCLSEMGGLLGELTQVNQDQVGERFAELEKPWTGDYVEQLEMTVTLLQSAVAKGVKLSNKYLVVLR